MDFDQNRQIPHETIINRDNAIYILRYDETHEYLRRKLMLDTSGTRILKIKAAGVLPHQASHDDPHYGFGQGIC